MIHITQSLLNHSHQYSNAYEVKPTIFPDGTQQVWQLPTRILNLPTSTVVWHYENDAEIITIRQLFSLLGGKPKYLYVPYLPYGRQDKEISNNSAFGFKILLSILSQASLKIATRDPHNYELCIANNIDIERVDLLIQDLFIQHKYTAVCFPDKGAKNRYALDDIPTIYAEKTRNQLTGQLTIDKINVPANVSTDSILVVDDICDGGATFELLGECLRKNLPKPPSRLDLYVSHGIFSKGITNLGKYYNSIFTTNSLYPLEPYLFEVTNATKPLISNRFLQS